MADAKMQTPEAQPVEKVKPVAGTEKVEETGEGKKFDLKSWKTWLIIVLVLAVVGGGIYLLL